eukprot:14021690-Alexandrium_andersonii.AAC.1
MAYASENEHVSHFPELPNAELRSSISQSRNASGDAVAHAHMPLPRLQSSLSDVAVLTVPRCSRSILMRSLAV